MQSVDVVVIGAGLAGLAAARALADQYDVLILEARGRVGGRTVGYTFSNGCTVEMGGQWIGRAHTELLRLVEELGLVTFPTYDEGSGLTIFAGERRPWVDETFGLPEAAAAEIARLHGVIGELADGVPVDEPWRAPSADELDRATVESWLTASTDDEVARAYFRVLTPAVFAAETHEVPWLHFLFYARSGGSLDYLITTTDGAQELRVAGGSHRIAERMADELGPGSVALATPVRELDQRGEVVRVVHDRGALAARHVVVTLPPALAGRLIYRPALPPPRDALTQAFPMGSVTKFQTLYDEPFWRVDGLSGQALSFDDPIATSFDNSPADGSCGVLLGFAEGTHARALQRLEPEARRRLVVGCLERFFGPSARSPRELVELDWAAEEYTRGCYGGRPGAGVWTGYGRALREPVGRIHWAGAETSPISFGYMDGAVRSGFRVAAEVADAL